MGSLEYRENVMSQRDANFKGGIQKGTVATDTVAKKLDQQCKTLKESISVEGLTMQKKIYQVFQVN